jgi:hypothetical protein
MSNYSKLTNFASKDSLASGNPLKVIKGTEIDDEFEAIETAVGTKADSASPTFTGTPTAPTASTGTDSTQLATTAFVQQEINANAPDLSGTYPVGSIYMNASVSTNPATLLGFGTWVSFGAGRVLVGLDSSDTDFDSAEETGGAKTHTLTSAQSGLPSHYHRVFSRGNEPTSSITFQNNQNRRYHEGGGHTNQTTRAGTLDGETEMHSGANASQAHNNLQPYIVVYMWKRTA